MYMYAYIFGFIFTPMECLFIKQGRNLYIESQVLYQEREALLMGTRKGLAQCGMKLLCNWLIVL